MNSTRPHAVKREVDDELLGHSVDHSVGNSIVGNDIAVKAEHSGSVVVVLPASIPSMSSAPSESQHTLAQGSSSEPLHASPDANRCVNPPGLHDQKPLIKPDPEAMSQSKMSNIPQSEVKLKVKPDAELDASLDEIQGSKETDYLEQLVHQEVPEILETGIDVAIKLLNQLKAPLEQCRKEDTDAWLKSINDLKSRAKPPRTVVGVVGNTGAGKSSVINALLDEER